MRLGNVKTVDFDIDDNWTKHTVDRIVNELKQEFIEDSSEWLVLNESTGQYEIDQVLMEAGIKDFLMKGAAKVKQAANKAGKGGKEAYDTMGAYLAKKMQVDMPEVFGKLKAYAGKHKTASAIIAVVGASLIAMEPAAASQAMDAISQTPIDSVADVVTSGADAGTQIPHGVTGQSLITDVMQSAQGAGANTEEIAKAMQSVKVHGMSVEDFANKAAELSSQSKDPDSFLTAAREKIVQALRDTQQGSEAPAPQGEPTVTTKQYTRSDMDPETARKLRGG